MKRTFNSKLDWKSKKKVFTSQQKMSHSDSDLNLYDLVFEAPNKFDEVILNYQVTKSTPLIKHIKDKILRCSFDDTKLSQEIIKLIDWSIFHRQTYPAVSAAQICNVPTEDLINLIYGYAFLVVGPTQLLDDKLDNPFAPELNIPSYEQKKITELWSLSDLMIRKGVEIFMSSSPSAFSYIYPLTFDMTYSMFLENNLKSYNKEILTRPKKVLQLYEGNYPPDLSSIFNDTMFIGAFIHLGSKAEDYKDWIPIARMFRLLRQQLNELEDFVIDSLCGFIKKPAALLLNNTNYSNSFKELIINHVWTKKNLSLIKEKSFQFESQSAFFDWIANQHYTIQMVDILKKSGILEKLYHQIDSLCFEINVLIEDKFKGKNRFDLLTILYLKKALLERLNQIDFLPQKVVNRKLLKLNNSIL